jgi:hypothetical protein
MSVPEGDGESGPGLEPWISAESVRSFEAVGDTWARIPGRSNRLGVRRESGRQVCNVGNACVGCRHLGVDDVTLLPVAAPVDGPTDGREGASQADPGGLINEFAQVALPAKAQLRAESEY